MRAKGMRIIGLLGSMAALLLVAAACYYGPQGSSLEATNVANGNATFTPIPSNTPPPTETPVEPSATPTEEAPPIQLISVTNTLDPVALASTQVAQADADAQATQRQLDLENSVGTLQVQNNQGTQVALAQLDPFFITATAFREQTNAAEGIVQPQPTQPQAQQAGPLSPEDILATATGIIQRSTNIPITQTWEALLGGTATPSLAPLQPTATPTQPAPVTGGGACTHTVVVGDNLFRISLRYNTTIANMAAANGIVNPALIIVGQVFNIPGCGSTPPTTGSGQTANPGTGEQAYTVQTGDTLFAISLRYNVNLNAIAQRNGISNSNLIYPNQQLVIPAGGTAVTTTTTIVQPTQQPALQVAPTQALIQILPTAQPTTFVPASAASG